MKISTKVIVAVLVVIALAIAGLMAQRSGSSAKKVSLSSHDMEVLVGEIMPPGQQQTLASNPEQRKVLAKRLRELLSIGQAAEQQGYGERPEVQSRIALQTDVALREAYTKKNPDAQVTDEEVSAYHQQHPNDFNSFLEANPRFKEQAQGPQGESLKKEFGEIKVFAERARKEGLDQTEETKLRLMLERNQALAQAYIEDLRKSDKLVTDADVEQYYNDHKDEFEEVKARHILVSTRPADEQEEAPATQPGKDKKEAAKPAKGLSKDEARKKAESLLARVRAGEDFAKLATEFTDDPGSKDKGGLYDFFGRGQMVPQFDQAAFSLKPGEVSELVETEYGYHIIKVEDRRTAPLDDPETKQKISDKLKQEKLEKHIEEIAANSSVQVAEDFNITPKPAALPQMLPPGHPGGPPNQ